MQRFLAQCPVCGMSQPIVADDRKQAERLGQLHHENRRILLRRKWYVCEERFRQELIDRHGYQALFFPVNWPPFVKEFPCQEVVLTSLGSRRSRRRRNRKNRQVR